MFNEYKFTLDCKLLKHITCSLRFEYLFTVTQVIHARTKVTLEMGEVT